MGLLLSKPPSYSDEKERPFKRETPSVKANIARKNAEGVSESVDWQVKGHKVLRWWTRVMKFGVEKMCSLQPSCIWLIVQSMPEGVD